MDWFFDLSTTDFSSGLSEETEMDSSKFWLSVFSTLVWTKYWFWAIRLEFEGLLLGLETFGSSLTVSEQDESCFWLVETWMPSSDVIILVWTWSCLVTACCSELIPDKDRRIRFKASKGSSVESRVCWNWFYIFVSIGFTIFENGIILTLRIVEHFNPFVLKK